MIGNWRNSTAGIALATAILASTAATVEAKPGQAQTTTPTTPTPGQPAAVELKGGQILEKPRPPSTSTTSTPTPGQPAAVELKGGQILEKPRPPQTTTTGTPTPTAAKVETGQLLDKGPRWPNKPSHFLTIGAGLATVGTIIAVASKKPSSP